MIFIEETLLQKLAVQKDRLHVTLPTQLSYLRPEARIMAYVWPSKRIINCIFSDGLKQLRIVCNI